MTDQEKGCEGLASLEWDYRAQATALHSFDGQSGLRAPAAAFKNPDEPLVKPARLIIDRLVVLTVRSEEVGNGARYWILPIPVPIPVAVAVAVPIAIPVPVAISAVAFRAACLPAGDVDAHVGHRTEELGRQAGIELLRRRGGPMRANAENDGERRPERLTPRHAPHQRPGRLIESVCRVHPRLVHVQALRAIVRNQPADS